MNECAEPFYAFVTVQYNWHIVKTLDRLYVQIIQFNRFLFALFSGVFSYIRVHTQLVSICSTRESSRHVCVHLSHLIFIRRYSQLCLVNRLSSFVSPRQASGNRREYTHSESVGCNIAHLPHPRNTFGLFFFCCCPVDCDAYLLISPAVFNHSPERTVSRLNS